MVYFLGRDVKVYIAAETTQHLFVHDTNLTLTSTGTGATRFAGQRGDAMNSGAHVTYMTGVDLGIVTTD